MSEEKQIKDDTNEKPLATARRGSRSAFAPIVLIAAGVFFLLSNIGVVGELDWQAATRFWPLALIFLGLNILVVQARPPLGTFLSALVALAAVGVFGYLLLSGSPDSVLRAVGVSTTSDLREETFNITPGVAETAAITLNLSNYPSLISGGGAENLVAGTIWTHTGLDMKPSSDADDHVEVSVGELPGAFVLNPFDWVQEDRTWEIFLSPDLPIDLNLVAGNGPVTADLAALDLSNLRIDASNGRLTAELPDGDYYARLDGGNGGIDLTLPAGGTQEIRINGGNGSIDLLLPQGVEARVEYDAGNGNVNVDGRFVRVEGDRDAGVYETDGYDGATDRLLLIIDTGNGAARVAAQ